MKLYACVQMKLSMLGPVSVCLSLELPFFPAVAIAVSILQNAIARGREGEGESLDVIK